MPLLPSSWNTKSISTATQLAIDLKAPLASPTFTGNVTGTSFNAITGLSSIIPLVDGVPAVGVSTNSSREDHIHPTDTTRASLDVVTSTVNGLMSSSDKVKLDNIPYTSTYSLGLSSVGTIINSVQTTDELLKKLTLDGFNNILVLPNNTCRMFKGSITAKDILDNSSCVWEVQILVTRSSNASTIIIIDTPVIIKLFETKSTKAWGVSTTVDTTAGCLNINVFGDTGKTINWVMKLDYMEVV